MSFEIICLMFDILAIGSLPLLSVLFIKKGVKALKKDPETKTYYNYENSHRKMIDINRVLCNGEEDPIYFSFTCMRVMIEFIVIFSVISFNQNIQTKMSSLLDKSNSNPGLLFAILGIITTASIFLVTFNKKQYLVFAMQEVIGMYRIKTILLALTIENFLLYLLDFFYDIITIQSMTNKWLYFSIYLLLFWEIILLEFLVMLIIFSIAFGDGKRELKVLGKLYRILSYYMLDELIFPEKEKWERSSIEYNINYLIENYIKACRKIDKKDINSIEFVKIEVGDAGWKKYALKYCKRIFIGICFYSLIVCGMLIGNNPKVLLIFFICEVLEIVLAVFIYRKLDKEKRDNNIMVLVLGFGTFRFNVNRGKARYVRSDLVGISKYAQFFQWCSSIIAFFYIWIKKIKKSQNLVEKMISEMTNKIEKENLNCVYAQLPILIVGYFLYEDKKDITIIKEIYNKVIENNKGNDNCLNSALRSQLTYILVDENSQKKYIKQLSEREADIEKHTKKRKTKKKI